MSVRIGNRPIDREHAPFVISEMSGNHNQSLERALESSVTLGATVIEKHVALSGADGGLESTFLVEPAEMAQLVVETERAWRALGQVSYGRPRQRRNPSSSAARCMWRKTLRLAMLPTLENVQAIRPSLGLPMKHLEVVLGKIVKQDVTREDGTGI